MLFPTKRINYIRNFKGQSLQPQHIVLYPISIISIELSVNILYSYGQSSKPLWKNYLNIS